MVLAPDLPPQCHDHSSRVGDLSLRATGCSQPVSLRQALGGSVFQERIAGIVRSPGCLADSKTREYTHRLRENAICKDMAKTALAGKPPLAPGDHAPSLRFGDDLFSWDVVRPALPGDERIAEGVEDAGLGGRLQAVAFDGLEREQRGVDGPDCRR